MTRQQCTSNINNEESEDEYLSPITTTPTSPLSNTSTSEEEGFEKVKNKKSSASTNKKKQPTTATATNATRESDCLRSVSSSTKVEYWVCINRWLDSFLSKWCIFSNNVILHDQGIRLLQYTLWFIAQKTKNGSNSELSPGLLKFCNQIGMARYIIRLYGGPVTFEAIRSGSWYNTWDDRRIHYLGKIMSWSMLFYYPFEHLAFGKWVAPKLLGATVDAEKHNAYSCRCWFVYNISDLCSSFFKWKELWRKKNHLLLLDDNKEKADSNIEIVNELNKKITYNNLHMIRCILFLLPSIHWSLSDWERNPWLAEKTNNGLLLSESIIAVYQSIRNI